VGAGPTQCHADSGFLKEDHLGNKGREDEPQRHAKTRRWPRLNCMDWMAGQLEGRQQEEGTRRSNPRPQGVIRPGNGTDVRLRFLRQAPGNGSSSPSWSWSWSAAKGRSIGHCCTWCVRGRWKAGSPSCRRASQCFATD
jgi:hypothetical protein